MGARYQGVGKNDPGKNGPRRNGPKDKVGKNGPARGLCENVLTEALKQPKRSWYGEQRGELLMGACRAGQERKKNKNTFSTEREVPAANGHDEDADEDEMFLSILQFPLRWKTPSWRPEIKVTSA